jgi:hypothetical protein
VSRDTRKKAPILQAFSDYGVIYLRLTDWLAGDAVLIAPVSMRIPCKQGILQGILQFWGSLRQTGAERPLCRRHFSRNSLFKLSGKIF